MAIYFITQKPYKYVKIGYTSRCPKKRLSNLNVGNPNRLELIGYIPGDKNLEKFIHSLIKKYHHKGEWYCFNSDIRKIIQFICGISLKDIFKFFKGFIK